MSEKQRQKPIAEGQSSREKHNAKAQGREDAKKNKKLTAETQRGRAAEKDKMTRV
jgi:hypothetical protein